MRDRLTGHPRGFGFVTYDDQTVAERVAAEFHELDGRQVEAKIAVPRSECIPAVRTSAIRATKKVFVGGLPATCRDPELRAHFSQFGDIAECQVMYDHQTGNSRGFGFVTFMSEATVDRVVEMEVHEILSKQVEVKRAEPKQALEARRGREAAAAAAAAAYSHTVSLPHSMMQASSAASLSMSLQGVSPASSAFSATGPATAAAIASPNAQPSLSSAPSLSFAPQNGRSPHGIPAFTSWTSLFSNPLGSPSNGAAYGTSFDGGLLSSTGRMHSGAASGCKAAAAAAAAAGVSHAVPTTPGGTGFFAPGHAYSGDLAQCAYEAFYASSAPGDVFSHEIPGGVSSARFDRRFHPYSNRERVDRTYL